MYLESFFRVACDRPPSSDLYESSEGGGIGYSLKQQNPEGGAVDLHEKMCRESWCFLRLMGLERTIFLQRGDT